MSLFEEEWAKMLNGYIYEASHKEFLHRLSITREKIWEFNSINPSDTVRREEIIKSLFGSVGDGFTINPPFRCDYGCNIHIGNNFFANFNLSILDEAEVRIGSDVFIGPNVAIFTACHPTDPDQRRSRIQWAKGVTIGDDVWIGGNVTILPGVTIGNGSTIGAGSVVSHDIPERCVAVGNPARVIKKI